MKIYFILPNLGLAEDVVHDFLLHKLINAGSRCCVSSRSAAAVRLYLLSPLQGRI